MLFTKNVACVLFGGMLMIAGPVFAEDVPPAVNAEAPAEGQWLYYDQATVMPADAPLDRNEQPAANAEVPAQMPAEVPTEVPAQPVPEAAPAEKALPDVDETALMAECYTGISQRMSPEELENFKKASETQLNEYHQTLGEWIGSRCVKPSGSKIRAYFNDRGVFAPTEISQIVLVSFHRHLNNSNVPLAQEIQNLQDAAKKNAEATPPPEDKDANKSGKKKGRK